jgi:hypothetical protein
MGSAERYWTFRLGLGAQTLPRQMLGERQSAFAVHVVLHAVVPHTKGVQFEVDTVWQVPVPLQVSCVDKWFCDAAFFCECKCLNDNFHFAFKRCVFWIVS